MGQAYEEGIAAATLRPPVVGSPTESTDGLRERSFHVAGVETSWHPERLSVVTGNKEALGELLKEFGHPCRSAGSLLALAGIHDGILPTLSSSPGPERQKVPSLRSTLLNIPSSWSAQRTRARYPRFLEKALHHIPTSADDLLYPLEDRGGVPK